MKFLPLLFANLRRKPLRLTFTLLSVLVAFLLFALLAAMHEAFTGGVELVGNERLITRHKISLIQPLPLAYEGRIEAVDGVIGVAHGDWLQGYYQDPRNFIPVIAVDDDYIDLYPEIIMPDAQRATWEKERTAAVIGKTVAEQFGWKVGDRVPLQSGIWQKSDGGNTWDVTIAAIYDSTSRAIDTASVFIKYDYFNESRQFGRDTVGWYIEKLADPDQAPQIAETIDALFANSTAESKTSTEKAWFQSFVAQVGDIGSIVIGIVGAVFFSMLLVTANTMAQSVRERTSELAVLKAIGFSDTGALALILGEAILVTLLGGGAGLLLGWLISKGLAQQLAQFLPTFYLTGGALLLGVLAAVLLGALAGLWPGVQALRLQIATALRKA